VNIIFVLSCLAYCVLLACVLMTNMVAHTPFEVRVFVGLHECVDGSSDAMAAASIASHSCVIDFGCHADCSERNTNCLM